MVFDLFHAKQNVLQWHEIKRSYGFFFFQSALYCKLLQGPVLFSSGCVRKIPGSEITSFLLSSSIGHAMEVGISDCLRVFNVMVTSKSPKGSLEGSFNVGVRKCQCQCLVLQIHCYCLPNARVHEDFIVYFVTGVWNAVRLPSTKTLSLQSLPNCAGQQARDLSAPLGVGACFLLIQRWKLVLICCAARGGSCLLAPGQQLSHSCACGWRMTKMILLFFGYVFKPEICKSGYVPRHLLCLLLPSNTYFPHNTSFSVSNFFHQL